jgi:F420-dependent oxidoreductase-like protein
MDLRIFTEPQRGASYEQLRAVAQATETLGFDGFFRSDHYLGMEGNGLPGPTDAWLTLAALARDTSRVRLGTLVTAGTFRLPGPLAIAVAQVDAMSGGRVELGLGAGWYEREHAAYGIPFPPVTERFERLEEQLAVITGLWSTPASERFSFAGRHYTLVDSPALPKPLQSLPPVIVGGTGPARTPALAARYADEFNLAFKPLATFVRQRDRVRAACGAAGRDPDELVYSVALTVCCGRNEAEVARRAGTIGRAPAELRARGAAGLPEEVLATLARYAEAGATRAYLQVLDVDDLDHLALLADQVQPGALAL